MGGEALTVVLQTIAANLGSILTPIGNTQNLAQEEGRIKGAYFRYFTAANICFLAVLLMFALICG